MRGIIAWIKKHWIVSTMVLLIIIKMLWVAWACWDNGSFDSEKEDILQLKNFLVEKILVDPLCLLCEMSGEIDLQFQGDEPIYVPDMFVAIVALSDYAKLNNKKYATTVNLWIEKAKQEWRDKGTGFLVSFLDDSGKTTVPIKGSYSALNCYYLTLIAPDFATGQYTKLKTYFAQSFPFSGIKEYHNRTCCAGIDIDAGPVILNLSPSGTAFAIGSATYFNDIEFRNKLLKTCEIAGHTVEWNNHRHYLLSNVALVGETITLAMRTNTLIHN